MFNWNKKEAPLKALAGLGGGVGRGVVSSNGHNASGGIISDYVSGGERYRAHIFYSPGNFNVAEIGEIDNTVEYLIVAGGGGGGANTPGGSYHGAGAGGGAGGLITNVPGVVAADNTSLTRNAQTVSAQSYPVVVGKGGAGANGVNLTNQAAQENGANSSIFGITALGGGHGSSNGSNGDSASNGGSGGGGGRENQTPGAATPNNNPDRQGYPGSSGYGVSNGRGPGGGGAGASGGDHNSATNGGLGVQVLIAGPESSGAAGYPGPNNQGGWFAGGGGGGGSGNTAPAGSGGGGGPTGSPYAGGGYGSPSYDDRNLASGFGGKSLSGGGGGGGGSMNGSPDYSWGGEGGSGIVVVRYKIGSTQTKSAKATGGAISFYNGRTIHTFLSPGTFENTSGSALGIDYVLVGGGGAGMNDAGSGGGAGGVLTNIPGMMPATTSISDVQTGAPNALTISIGQGGQGKRRYNNKISGVRNDGGDTTMSGTGINVTAIGGGSASATNSPGASTDGGFQDYSGRSGGSGGGARVGRTPALAGAGTAGQGNPGAGPQASGGGGGAGAPGSNGSGGDPSGHGGIGVQLPAIFQNPAETVGAPGPGGGGFWVAGGGGGGYTNGFGGSWNGSSRIPGGPYAGAGGATPGQGESGIDGTGSGGGGAYGQADNQYGGSGGSGIVLISYPT